MIELMGKKILLISPEKWGDMYLSKHHYAIELAARGNEVYFLNPPARANRQFIEVVKHESIANLYLINYRPFFKRSWFRNSQRLYDLLMSWQIKLLLRKIGGSFNITWCFDTNSFNDLSLFRSDYIIYHVVDQLANDNGVLPACNADLIISVASELLSKFAKIPTPKMVINHGLSSYFEPYAINRLENSDREAIEGRRIRIGYVGNLFAKILDRMTLKKVILDNPNIDFIFWGASEVRECNVGAYVNDASVEFLNFLRKSTNVSLMGSTKPSALAREIQNIDGFIICYDTAADKNRGCNTHKILEYLSTGKVIISSRISNYSEYRSLIQMVEGEHNQEFGELFRETVQNIDYYNQVKYQRQRIEIALRHTYKNHIIAIEVKLNNIRGEMIDMALR